MNDGVEANAGFHELTYLEPHYLIDSKISLYTTNFIGPLSYQAFSFLKLLALS